MADKAVTPSEWTGQRIHEAHTGGGGPYSWVELEGLTGLTLGQLRGRARCYRQHIGHQSRRGQQHIYNSDDAEKWEQQGPNQARGRATFDFPASLPDLLERLNVDTSIWEVERWGYSSRVNDWEGYGKIEAKDLTYVDGVPSGRVMSEGLQTVPLHSERSAIWAAFRRKEPISISPVIHPVLCPVTYRKPKLPKRKGIRRELFIGDLQIGFRREIRSGLLIPFHDRRVLDLALQIAIAAKVDAVRFGGDVVDMTEWTDKFIREPAFYQTTQPTFYEWHWHLRRYREALPDAALVWMWGNHEDRLRRMLLAHLPMAYGLTGVWEGALPALSFQNLLQLDKLGVEYVAGYEGQLEWLNDEFAICHGEIVRSQPGATARALLDDKRAKLVFFHVHRQEMAARAWETQSGKITVFAYCPGCACHIDGRVPGSKPGNNWQQGFSIGEYDVGGKLASVQLIPVEDGRAIWDGQLFAAGDTLSQLRADLPEWNWGE